MQGSSRRTAGLTVGGTLAVAALMAVGVVGVTNTDQVVERGFANALGNAKAGSAPAPTLAAEASISGSEDFWLRQTRQQLGGRANVELVSGTNPLKLGDTLKLTVGGSERTYEVVDVTAVPGITHIETGPATRLVVITCRDKASPDSVPLRLVSEIPAEQLGNPAPDRASSL